MLTKALTTIRKYHMLEKGDNVLVAVSGGADSVSLLDALYKLKDKLRIKLAVVHLNHMLRGPESDKDMRFVENLAGRYKLPFYKDSVDVKGKAKREGRSIEDAARRARYEFFERAAKKAGCGKIALGHTGDDQAETILMRLLRGSGLKGLGGIPPVRRLGDADIIRPLIELRKDELKSYLDTRGMCCMEDASNEDDAFIRNKIRNSLIPYLSKNYNGNIKEVLRNTADNLSTDYEYISKEAGKVFKKTAHKESGGAVVLDIQKVTSQPEAIQRYVVRQAIGCVKGVLEGVEYKNWSDIKKLFTGGTGRTVDVGGGVAASREYDKLTFFVRKKSVDDGPFHRLPVPGSVNVEGVNISAELVNGKGKARSSGRLSEKFDYDKLDLPLIVRYRRPGDRMRPLGMKGSQKVKKILIDRKVPRRLRERLPVIISGDEIIWVPGMKVSDAAKITDGSKRLVEISVL